MGREGSWNGSQGVKEGKKDRNGNGEGKEGKAKGEKGEGEERERMLEGKWELEVECLESGKEGTKVRERGKEWNGEAGNGWEVGKEWERGK